MCLTTFVLTSPLHTNMNFFFISSYNQRILSNSAASVIFVESVRPHAGKSSDIELICMSNASWMTSEHMCSSLPLYCPTCKTKT